MTQCTMFPPWSILEIIAEPSGILKSLFIAISVNIGAISVAMYKEIAIMIAPTITE